MHILKLRKALLLVPLALLILLALSMAYNFAVAGPSANNQDGVFALEAPPFINTAHAESSEPNFGGSDFPDDEVGISAYFNAGQTIELDDVDHLYRTIEDQTSDYIIGSMPVTDYNEQSDVHVYIHTSGWVMEYYQTSVPVGKLFDWVHYSIDSNLLPTRFEPVRDDIANAIGIALPDLTYYHFDYPNANTLMLIADGSTSGDSFQVNIPSGYTYFERSWSLQNTRYRINGTEVGASGGLASGVLTPTQLPADTLHTISGDGFNGQERFGLALIYQQP